MASFESFYDKSVFSSKIDKAMKVADNILSTTRNPRIASVDQDHTYDDKFDLSEFLSKIALASLLNAFEKLGLDKTTLQKLVVALAEQTRSVTLRFASNEKCEFIKEEEIDVTVGRTEGESLAKSELRSGWVELMDPSSGKPYYYNKAKDSTTFEKPLVLRQKEIVTSVKQYHWKRYVEYSMFIYTGNDSRADSDNSRVLIKSNPSYEVITRGSKKAPFASEIVNDPVDVSLTWMIQRLNTETSTVEFEINRNESSCRTPSHNNETRDAWTHFSEISKWCASVNAYLIRMEKLDATGNSFAEEPISNNVGLSTIKGDEIFVPVLPIFESLKDTGTSPSSPSPLLKLQDVNNFLDEQRRTMSEQITVISSQFSPSSEAIIVLLNTHIMRISEFWKHGIQHIESMLCKQLFDAIGKSVDSKDLNEFVRFNNQRLFSDTYAPEPFCYAIRRPNHYPDGIISIEDEFKEQISTFTRKLEKKENRYPMHIPISSATSVEFKGDLYLHAWILQKFGKKPSSFVLASRARQFSCFLLLIGKLSGPDTFEPEHGIILQNKDELLLPLLLEEMPSPKEFKDAIASLSPEQQKFAQLFRNMKLSSSVFGICVVQLKPQLEALLGLPDKSLTKEIQLTQDLLSLFIDFQIPSDLLSYDGPDEIDISEKVGVVKGHVKDVNDMIEGAKEKDLTNATRIRSMNEAVADATMMESMNAYHSQSFGASNCPASGSMGAPAGDVFFGAVGGGICAAPRSTRTCAAPRSTRHAYSSASRPTSFAAAPVRRGLFGGSAGAAPLKREFSDIGGAAPAPPGSSLGGGGVTNVAREPASSSANDKRRRQDNQRGEVSDNFKASNDLTDIPKILDTQFEKIGDAETYAGSLKSTVIKVGYDWRKKSKLNILSSPNNTILHANEQREEKDKAFDLLDALSRSGSLPIACAELHLIVASTHCFEQSVMNTVVKDNINPIEKIERSNLLVASVIHGVKAVELLRDKGEINCISQNAPYLLTEQEDMLL